MNLSDAIKQIEKIPHAHISNISQRISDGSYTISFIFNPLVEEMEQPEPQIRNTEPEPTEPQGKTFRGYTQEERDIIRSASSANDAAKSYKRVFGDAKPEINIKKLYYLWKYNGKLFIEGDRVVIVDTNHRDCGLNGKVLKSIPQNVSIKLDNGCMRWVTPEQIRRL